MDALYLGVKGNEAVTAVLIIVVVVVNSVRDLSVQVRNDTLNEIRCLHRLFVCPHMSQLNILFCSREISIIDQPCSF